MRKTVALLMCLFLIGCGFNYKTKYPTTEEVRPCFLASVALVNSKGKAVGAGTIILNQEGRFLKVVTAAHVVQAFHEKNELVGILFGYSTTPILADVFDIDHDRDIAVLQGLEPQTKDGPFITVAGDKVVPLVGEKIILIGSPAGSTHVVTSGTITGYAKYEETMQYRIDAASFFGNSGGGLFNSDGKLIGILQGGQMIGGLVPIPGAAFALTLTHIRDFLYK